MKRRNQTKPSQRKYARHVSVASGEGLRVDKKITINTPVREVYAFWTDLENLPRFMRHIESVTMLDSVRSRWKVKTLAGTIMEWDAELIEQRENEMISWRSLPHADVDNAGSVWFEPALDGHGTTVRVALKYEPPMGKLGASVARLFGSGAEAEIEEDLLQLKSLLESGDVPVARGPRVGHDVASRPPIANAPKAASQLRSKPRRVYD